MSVFFTFLSLGPGPLVLSAHFCTAQMISTPCSDLGSALPNLVTIDNPLVLGASVFSSVDRENSTYLSGFQACWGSRA